MTAGRLHRIAHWAGIALALPVLAAAALGLALWFDGLPSTFTAADGICRGIGYAILWLLTPTGPPGRS
jgi:hypothetical protein